MYRDRIRENYEHLSKSQKRIADFLMTSHREAAFMTASQLAGVLDVDVATITRFAQRLAYPGYPDLLDEVQTLVRDEMSAGFHSVEGSTDPGRFFVHMLAMQRENLERTLTNISVEAAEVAINILMNARTIYIVGQHTAAILAASMAIRLRTLDLKAVEVTGDAVSVSFQLRALSSEDAVVAFGFSSYASDVAAIMHIAHDRGAKTIGISGSDVSPVARGADVALVCSAASPLHIPSESAINAVIEALTLALAYQRMAALTENLNNFTQFYEQFVHYVSHPVESPQEIIWKHY